jgi:hypothetical protein
LSSRGWSRAGAPKPSTRAHTISAALKHLARFEGDPAGYEKKDEEEEPVFLPEPLADEFLARSRDAKKNSPNWISTQKILPRVVAARSSWVAIFASSICATTSIRCCSMFLGKRTGSRCSRR